MKNLLLTVGFIFCATNLFSQSFVSPIGFVASESNKQKVVNFIKKQVNEEYSAIGMDDPLTLRMMEKENLNAFKKLTEATNKKLLNSVIKTYCDIGMCNYTTIAMMYNEQNKANKKSLKW